MEFTNNKQFTATGSDEVGPFTFEDGKITGMMLLDLKVKYLTIFMHSTELAIIISCPMSESEIVVLLKMTPKIEKFI